MRSKQSSTEIPQVVIAGGGVAGLEGLLALRALAGNRVQLELISPDRTFAYRPLAVAAAFGGGTGPRIDVADLARSVQADWVADTVTAVDTAENAVTLAGGEQRGYDVLLVASGARSRPAVPGAITFGLPGATKRFQQMLEEAGTGQVSQIVFAVPCDSGWPLALYELAMMTARHLRARGADPRITLLTPEQAPLAVFGGRASGAVLEDLENLGIHFVAGLEPQELAWGELRAGPGAVRIQADAVVTLPLLSGPDLTGLPHDEHGFIPVDLHGRVRGLPGVYAAGDAIAFPVKHGGLAAQQAGAAAEAIAAALGAPVNPAPFRPVLRGMLLTGENPRYLEAAVRGDRPGSASDQPLWWPPAKIAGHYLAPYLSGQISTQPAPAGLR